MTLNVLPPQDEPKLRLIAIFMQSLFYGEPVSFNRGATTSSNPFSSLFERYFHCAGILFVLAVQEEPNVNEPSGKCYVRPDCSLLRPYDDGK